MLDVAKLRARHVKLGGAERSLYHGNPSPLGGGYVGRYHGWASSMWPDRISDGKGSVSTTQGIPTGSPRTLTQAKSREEWTMHLELGQRAKDALFGNFGPARKQRSLGEAGTREVLVRHVSVSKRKASILAELDELREAHREPSIHPVVLGSELARHLGIQTIGNVE